MSGRRIAASTSRDAGHPTARAGARALAAALLAAACAAAPPADSPTPAPPAATPGGLRVVLEFDAEADLDLYVSDPFHETVYFANTPVRSGGKLVADRRCGDLEPRIEVVAWREPPPGIYRVGVDFPERCNDDVEAAPFRLTVEGPGVLDSLEGEARFGRFGARTFSFEIGSRGASGAGFSDADLDASPAGR